MQQSQDILFALVLCMLLRKHNLVSSGSYMPRLTARVPGGWQGGQHLCGARMQVAWAQGATDALQRGGGRPLHFWADQCERDLAAEVMLVRGSLEPLQRATLGALVVIDVHARDVAAELVSSEVRPVAPFILPASVSQDVHRRWLVYVHQNPAARLRLASLALACRA